MRIKKSELLKVLGLVKPGLSNKEIIEQATHFIFVNNEVVTFNDRLCIMAPFELDAEFSVKGEEFAKIISGLSEDSFELTATEESINIKSESTKVTLSTVVGEAARVDHLIDLLRNEIEKEGFWQPLPKEFIDAVYLCAFSANKDVATGVRACVCISEDNVMSTDNIRASNYIMDASMQSMILPAKDIMDLVKHPVIEYGISDNWVHFRTEDGVIFNCKAFTGDYPKALVVSLFEQESSVLEFPSGLKEVVNSVVVLAEGELDINKMVRVKIEKNKITVIAEKERGKIEKKMPFEYKGEPISFIINPIFFSQILNHATGFLLANGKAQFEAGNFVHVMSLPVEE